MFILYSVNPASTTTAKSPLSDSHHKTPDVEANPGKSTLTKLPARPGAESIQDTSLSTATGSIQSKPDTPQSTGEGNKLKEALTKLQKVIENTLAKITGHQKSEAPTVAKSKGTDLNSTVSSSGIDKPELTTKTDQSDDKDNLFAAIIMFLTTVLETATQEKSTTLAAETKSKESSPTSDVSKMKTTPPLETGFAKPSSSDEGLI